MEDIVTSGLSKAYAGKTVFSNLSMSVRKGEIVCLMGPSGCGKTTLLRLIAGLERADAGEIRGVNARGLSFVFQEDRLVSHLSALSNCALVLSGKLARDTALSALSALGLADNAQKSARELSGGMARRVAIARAMIAEAECILMDEPFKGLDETNKQNAIAYVKRAREGRTLIVVTHDEAEARALDGRIIDMGQIVAE